MYVCNIFLIYEPAESGISGLNIAGTLCYSYAMYACIHAQSTNE